MISKQLLSLILSVNIKNIYKIGSNPNFGEEDFLYSVVGNGDLENINVYSLAAKVKKWCVENSRFYICSWENSGGCGASVYTNYSEDTFFIISGKDYEYEAIFECAEWILKNKGK